MKKKNQKSCTDDPCMSCMAYHIFFTLLCLGFIVASSCQAGQYADNRATFARNMEAENNRLNQQLKTFDRELQEIDNQKTLAQQEAKETQARIDGYETTGTILSGMQHVASAFFFPLFKLFSSTLLMGMWSVGNKFFFIVLTITAINLFFYLAKREAPFFKRNKVVVIVLLVTFLLSFACPLFAQDQDRRAGVAQKLKETAEILRQSDHQRYIAILESEEQRSISIPQIDSGSPWLKVYSHISPESAERYVTLAALYTYEGQNGKAIDAIQKIIDNPGRLRGGENDELIANTIKFLVECNDLEKSGKAIEMLCVKVGDIGVLLELSNFLRKKNMPTSAETIFQFAMDKAQSATELVQLAEAFFAQGDSDKGRQALDQALSVCDSVAQLVNVARVGIRFSRDDVLKRLIERVAEIRFDFEDALPLIDLLLDNGRVEDATIIFSQMIQSIGRGTLHYREKLIFLIEHSLRRTLHEQTINAIEKYIGIVGPADTFVETLVLPVPLKRNPDLPDGQRVTIALLYGLLNDERSFLDKSENAYISSVEQSLEGILASYGYSLPESLNEFHLLGQAWTRENLADLLDRLDGVYTYLERDRLLELQQKNEEIISAKRVETEQSRASLERLQAELSSLRSKEKSVMKKTALNIIATGGMVLFLLMVAVGCVIKARTHADKLAGQKTFGFFSKLIEAVGWVKVMSLLGLVSGVALVLVAQVLMIFQGINEHCHVVARTWTDIPGVDLEDE